ncbi:hypothetical protein D3Y57_03690 (plasmid) [Sphingomonas paeninsulae]|uniref:EthD domain-containing protein n=1 Tax=Sphingomonas paeninsulae TaxID=2319844 RepID=A0A494TD13_SPHPE|nr:DUF4286 family protein [Sphingomonas paeninsulae]AYJ85144.1 hypothetical protein D3Y57_03690 [Sphingomonas paeninsulae]
MTQGKLVVLTRPVKGREDEFNTWYNDQHLDDVLAIPGFVAAQRFKIKGTAISPNSWDYFAVYEVDHDNPQEVLDDMMSRVGTDRMRMSEAMAEDLYCVLYESITERKVAKTV